MVLVVFVIRHYFSTTNQQFFFLWHWKCVSLKIGYRDHSIFFVVTFLVEFCRYFSCYRFKSVILSISTVILNEIKPNHHNINISSDQRLEVYGFTTKWTYCTELWLISLKIRILIQRDITINISIHSSSPIPRSHA